MREPDQDGSLRVALLSPCYWPEVRRGAERFTRELADGLLAAGHRPTLITSHPGLPSLSREEGLAVLRLPRPPQGRLLRRGYEPYLTHLPFSYLALHAGRFDLAHATYPADALAASWWKRTSRRPVILSYMGVPDFAGLREYRRRLEHLERAVERCDAVVALSHYAAGAFRYWLGYDARVMPPGVNLDAFTPVSARTPHPTVLCSAAADVPRKHVGLLVRAFSLIRERHPDAELILSAPRDLEAARRAGVEVGAAGVRWVDLDERTELARRYAQAWAVVLPSEDEAFGLVLVEALACGTPVVGLAHAAIPEVVNDEAIGRLFHRLDPESLSDALLDTMRLAEDPATAARCRRHAEQFSAQRCSARYLALYSELLSARAQGS